MTLEVELGLRTELGGGCALLEEGELLHRLLLERLLQRLHFLGAKRRQARHGQLVQRTLRTHRQHLTKTKPNKTKQTNAKSLI